MSKTIDARKLACPEPVMLTKKALESADEVVTVVDNEAARENVARLGRSEGCQVSVETREDGIYLRLRKSGPMPATPPTPSGRGTVVLIAADVLGRGENQPLGGLLMQSFLNTVDGLSSRPETIIFINSGVKLVARDSPVLGELHQLEAHKVEILACGTCLSRYGLTDKVAVGQVSNMFVIADTLLKAQKVLSL